MRNSQLQEKSESTHKNEQDKFRIYATVAFIVVTLVVGVPMWWVTTTVYRFGLPSSDIMSLSAKPIRSTITISIFSFKEARGKLLTEELKSQFEANDFWQLQFVHLLPNKKFEELKTAANLESELLSLYPQAPGDFMFIEWPKLREEEVLLTTQRSALIRSDSTSSKLKLVLNQVLLQTHRIKQILTDDSRRILKSEAPQPEYDVIVSVLNPAPDSMLVKWNVKQAVNDYLAPFLKHISSVSSYTLKTQWKYFVKISTKLKQVTDKTKLGRHYALEESMLPYVITSIEGSLGVGIRKPNIHLVVYIPPCNSAPIRIYPKSNKNAVHNQSVNAFISPKWGGLIIANPPEQLCLEYNVNRTAIEYHMKHENVMQIILYQLYKLTGIITEHSVPGVSQVALEDLVPHTWEYESFVRRSAIMHVSTATKTLQSLVKLLDKINYIVINDDVGQQIFDSYEYILKAKEALLANELSNATAFAKRAFEISDRVFFDASLLAQLYFPDEQKYAVYVPLFLPILFPVIASFPTLRKLLAKGMKRKTD